MGVVFYNNADNFQTFILYFILGAFICILPTGLICAICENLYNKVYNMIISDTEINAEYNRLYALYNPYETNLKSLINEYINNKYLEIISEIKYDSNNYQLKNDFKENHRLLQVVLSSPLYIYKLSNFLIESEKIIESFQSTDNNKKTNSKATNSDYIGGTSNTIITDTTSVQFSPQILPSHSGIRKTVRKLTIEDLMPEADGNKVESPEIHIKRASNTNDNPKATTIRKAKKIDWIAVNKAKNDVGLGGEILVLSYEINKLLALNMGEYASKVEHVSVTQGDGLGYDMVSFDER
ncbi:hypothetical protein, partial [Hymenobacter lapidiphilus]|nr:hypothetical protein [Hymenobacter lapidiphilus]